MKGRMMKGDEEPEMVIGAIIFVMAIGFVFLIVFMVMTDYSTAMAANQDVIAAIGDAHRAVACLGNGDAAVQGSEITQKTLDSCGIKDYRVCVKDMDDASKKWLDCNMSSIDHTVYFALETGGAIHMGRLDVRKK